MSIWFECICGAQNDAPDPGPRGLVRCTSCGAELDFGGVFDGPSAWNDPEIPDPKLDCPACGGGAEIVRGGADGRDRILSCDYCGTEVDLPEVRGRTRERVTERPGERIVERVTSWEGAEPDLPSASQAAGVDLSFDVDGQSFDSLEAMTRHVREHFPEDVANQLLQSVERTLREGGAEHTTVIDHTHVRSVGQSLEAPRPRRRRN